MQRERDGRPLWITASQEKRRPRQEEVTARRSDSIHVMNSKDMDAYIEQIKEVRKLFKTPSGRLHHLHARAESGVSFPPLSRGVRHGIILLSSRPTKLEPVNKKAIPPGGRLLRSTLLLYHHR